jgi:hypothetical protein
MAATIAGVFCEEIVRDYKESVDPDPIITKLYTCPWPQRYAAANGMLGFATANRNGVVTFNPAYRHPESPSLVAQRISITGRGQPTQGPLQLQYPTAVIEVQFLAQNWVGLPQDDPDGSQAIDPSSKFLYCTQTVDFGCEYVTIPGSSLVYQSSGHAGIGVVSRPFNQDVPLRVQHAEMSLTFHKLPYIFVSFLPLIDNVNKTTFLGQPPQCVKFNGGNVQREFQSDGSVTQAVQLSFSCRPNHTWNQVPDPGGSSAWVGYSYADGTPVFPPADLTQVFPQGYQY